jgi:SHS2 domain-containing protein
MSARGHDLFDVEADVGVRAWGPTMADAFAEAALAVFSVLVDPHDVEPRETREVRAQGESIEVLLVRWIDECLYVHEIEGFVVSGVDVDAFETGMVHGVLHGEEFDRARHRPGTIVKAATFHGVSAVTRGDGAEVRVVLDV